MYVYIYIFIYVHICRKQVKKTKTNLYIYINLQIRFWSSGRDQACLLDVFKGRLQRLTWRRATTETALSTFMVWL